MLQTSVFSLHIFRSGTVSPSKKKTVVFENPNQEVFRHKGPSLLGRDWLKKLPINIFATCNQIEWTDLNQEFAELF